MTFTKEFKNRFQEAYRQRFASSEKSRHTPGPWKVFEDDFYVVGIESKDAIIADHLYESNDETIDDIKPELEANARLIAAAPDLLEACQLVERAHVGDGVDMAVAVDTCLLAIKKATE